LSDLRRPCNLIQEDIAWGRGLSAEDQEHVLSCRACSETAAQFEALDSLVRNAMDADVPEGFADRVVSQIEAEQQGESIPLAGRFPSWERIFFSKAVQWGLVGIGSAFGLLRVIKFFAEVVIHAAG
jgi:anti-sigma factor RsiW